MGDWTDQDSTAAARQGWFLCLVWDEWLQYEIVKTVLGSPFESDEKARAFVATAAKAGDAIAQKAVVIAFRSKCGPTLKPKGKGKKK